MRRVQGIPSSKAYFLGLGPPQCLARRELQSRSTPRRPSRNLPRLSFTLNNRNNSGSDADVEAATQSIVDGLTEQYGLTVSRWDGASEIQSLDELRRIAVKTGARYVAEGTYYKVGGRIKLSILLYDVRGNPYNLWSDSRRTGDDWARNGVTGESVRVDRDLSWVIDEFTRTIYETIDGLGKSSATK